MSSKDQLIEFLGEQIKIEKEIIDSLNKALINMENLAVKNILKGISLDSLKHAWMYGSAVTLLTKVPKVLTQEQFDMQREIVKRHIEIEARLIKQISKELRKVKNVKIQLLLNTILLDERRHHRLLKKVLETFLRGETITEEEWFDVMWGSVPFHGSPGG